MDLNNLCTEYYTNEKLNFITEYNKSYKKIDSKYINNSSNNNDSVLEYLINSAKKGIERINIYNFNNYSGHTKIFNETINGCYLSKDYKVLPNYIRTTMSDINIEKCEYYTNYVKELNKQFNLNIKITDKCYTSIESYIDLKPIKN